MRTPTAPADTITAAVYLRQSLDRDGRELAVSRQREDVTKLCAERGWRMLEYVDNDTSASNGTRRPAYQQMLADIADGLVQAVAVWHVDRLHRQPRELEDFIDLADEHGIALATVSGQVDLSTDMGRLVARIVGAVAKAEVERKGARQRRAAQQRAESGRAWSPVRVFGYTPAQSDGTGMQIVESEAAHLREAYAGVLAGRSLQGIAKEWNTKGIKTSRGNTWKGTTLRMVLVNARYAGLRAYKGDIVGQAVWPAIVTEDVYRGAVAVLSDPARLRVPTGGHGRKWLLTGIALCGKCGATVGTTTSHGRPVYYCRACCGLSRHMALVDEWVVAHVVARLARPDAAELLVDQNREDIAALRDQAAALRARQDELAGLFAAGDITGSQLKTATAALTGQLDGIESRMLDANRTRVFDGLIGVEDVAARFDALPLDRKRAVVAALVSITIMQGQPPRGRFRTELVLVEPRL
ncbi:recombinase family protein [Mycolicibacterium neoaurum]|uniref:recombinase family protein n=1 Tax=Mycolicibacterium neoaurum TaxID=1795 RepID=UPI001BCCB16A|nr:recombinase family protein [Mycolicibacterium neoaurum]QVI26181.1 recombinase family protein [Mycolicibacterium neoaurum]